jgi:hypothetical protein
MAFHRIHSHELAKVGRTLARADRDKRSKAERKHQAICAAETVGGGLAIGFVRGKMEDANGQWLIPGTTLDIEMVAGTALTLGPIVAPMFGVDAFDEYESDLVSAGAGMLAHYLGQAGRNFAKTGTLAWPLVAGRNPVIGHQRGDYVGAPIVGEPDLAEALSALSARRR